MCTTCYAALGGRFNPGGTVLFMFYTVYSPSTI